MGRLNVRRVVVLLAAVMLAALTARLGVWQLDRAGQKERLQAAIDARRDLPHLPAAALALAPGEAQAQHHRRIELRGQWLPQHTVFLENRQMQGRPGFFVLTPLQLPDGSAVIVQRGWLPRDPVDRTRVSAPAPLAGEVAVSGRIAPPPARLYDFEGGAAGVIRQNLDLQSFAVETGLRLRPLSVLELAPAAAAPAAGGGDGLARDWPAPAADVHKHYGYAFQWFSLSALTVILYVWFQVLRPRRRPA
jgi:surfeit locus 1 family protein